MMFRRISPLVLVSLALGYPATWSTIAQQWIQTSAPVTNWWAVASSANGSNLVAVAGGDGTAIGNDGKGLVYTSSDSGKTWVVRLAPAFAWRTAASSARGDKLIVAALPGPIYTSIDSGVTWVSSNLPQRNWSSVASSADGNKMVAVVWGESIYTSTNAGSTWNPTYVRDQSWTSVASSADGNKLVAGIWFDPIQRSTNAGATWTQTSTPNPGWKCLASSADGVRLAAGARDIYFSTDSGTTWTVSPANANWVSVASSSDGVNLVAACVADIGNPTNGIFMSTNGGTTWALTECPDARWSSVASSADGSKLVATVRGGGIYTWQAIPSLSLTLSDGNLVLSWAATSASVGFRLQQRPELTGTNWLDVLDTPMLVGNRNQIILSQPTGRGFFRLRQL